MNVRGIAASPLGFLVGVVMGALGGGGAVLAVPILVYVAGQEPQDATSSALLIVMLAALGGIVPHARDGNVRFRAGLAFGAAGIAGSIGGSTLNTFVPPDVLLLCFAVLLVVVAVVMYQRSAHVEPDVPGGTAEPGTDAIPGADVAPGTLTVGANRAVEVLASGTAIGLLTGFFGVGGGFVIVPTLIFVLRFPVREAVGTSLLVIAINSLVALIARQAWGTIEWSVALPFAAAALLGVVAGRSVAARFPTGALMRIFAVLLFAVAAYTGIRSVLAL